jgi:hypothetical protein
MVLLPRAVKLKPLSNPCPHKLIAIFSSKHCHRLFSCTVTWGNLIYFQPPKVTQDRVDLVLVFLGQMKSTQKPGALVR